MLFTLQRYEFFSKSQPRLDPMPAPSRCCLPYKGTNFSANHNTFFYLHITNSDVVYPTKVRIFQQITTDTEVGIKACKMLFTLQRYEFFSKSQLVPFNTIFRGWCCLPYKGTNFSANHNFLPLRWVSFVDVVYPTKVRIFQQITTCLTIIVISNAMLFTLQRYEFFSKSQLHQAKSTIMTWCCLPYKGTNFSANHNRSVLTM